MPPAHAHPGRFTCLSHQAGPTIHQHYSGLSHPLLILPRLVLPYQSHPGRSRSTSCAALRRRSSGSKPPWTMPNRFCSCGLQRGRSVCVYGCVYVCICVCVCVCLCGAGQVYMCVGRGKGACVRAHVYVYAYVCAYAHLHAGHVGASKLSLCIQLTIQESSSKERHAPCCPLPCPLPAAPCRPCCPLLPPACSGRRAGPMSPLHQQAWQNLNLVVNTAKRLSCAAMHRSPQHMV